VIAAACIGRALGFQAHEVLLATLAWDRLLVDPAPGPRAAADFDGLKRLGLVNHEVLPTSRARPPYGSLLPRLSGELGSHVMLLDPAGGVEGLSQQLRELAWEPPSMLPVYLVDVGGDVLAHGHEEGLSSPVSDAMLLAACHQLDTSVTLLVAGPGLDGELTRDQVHTSLGAFEASKLLALGEPETDLALGVLEWHPSEATALLVAAARGLVGTAEIRGGGLRVRIDPRSSVVWGLDARKTRALPLPASVTGSQSLSEVEERLRGLLGWSELDRERDKATRLERVRPVTRPELMDEQLRAFERSAASRGVDFVTFRRVAEAVSAASMHADIRSYLIAKDPIRYLPPLWSTRSETSSSLA
jgi:hypothetical protein